MSLAPDRLDCTVNWGTIRAASVAVAVTLAAAMATLPGAALAPLTAAAARFRDSSSPAAVPPAPSDRSGPRSQPQYFAPPATRMAPSGFHSAPAFHGGGAGFSRSGGSGFSHSGRSH